MNQWNFYFSGILYGVFQEDEDQLFLKKRNIQTAGLESARPAREEDWDFFQALCSRRLSFFFQERHSLEAAIEKEPDSFHMESGELFTRRRQDSYIQREKKFPMDLFYDREGTPGERIYAVSMTCRDSCAVLVRDGREQDTVLKKWGDALSAPVSPVRFAGTFAVPTRDGEFLAADVYLPGDKTAPVPAVLIRTPYGKGVGKEVYSRFVQRGYAVVIQDTRGREDSTGTWQPNYYEVEDGDDTLNWIAAQSWSDGQAAMTGGSYLGYVQWAAAASGNPHLKALLSFVCAGSAFIDLPRRGGCFTSGMLAWAFSMSEKRMKKELMAQDNWDEILDYRPLSELPKKALGKDMPFVEEWLRHPDLDDFWKQSSWKDRYQNNPVPALIVSGWFDDNGMGTTEALYLVSDWPKGTWKAVLGPWKHSGNADYDLHGTFMGEDALRYDIDLLCFLWLEHFLKGKENGIEKTAAVEYYTLGENCWKTRADWPSAAKKKAGDTAHVLYLGGTRQDGGAAGSETICGNETACGDGSVCDNEAACENGTACGSEMVNGSGTICSGGTARGNGTACGSGTLSETLSQKAGQDFYRYDPDHPAHHIIDMAENELEVPEDYTKEETRTDILTYSTEVFREPFSMTGDFMVHLFVSCDCPDTDFVVRITDVDENGTSIKLADGVLDAKYRKDFSHPEFMEPGQVYELSIRTTKLSNTFLPGHRLRLTVTSSAKNFIFPNSNTKGGFDSKEKQIAGITVHWGGSFPSCIEFTS